MTIPNKRKTISTIEDALEEKQSAAIGEIVEIIQKLAANASTLSINELADIIGRDPAMVEKVIGSANTIGYKANVEPVLTITQAIHTVGYEKIRNLAIALIFTESTVQKSNTYEQREIAALSVCSGILAQNISADHSNLIEPELVFVCATLRSFGKLLLSSFLVDKYRAVKSQALELDEDEAFKKEYGLTPLEVGSHFLNQTNVPKVILQTIKKIPERLLTQPAKNTDEALLFSSLSTTICELAFDEKLSPEQFEIALQDTLLIYHSCLPIELKTINNAIATLEEELSSFNRMMGIPDELSPGSVKLKARQSGKSLPQTPKISKQENASIKPILSKEEEVQNKISLSQTIEKISNKLRLNKPISLHETYQEIVESTKRSLNLENCLIFIPEEYEEEKFSSHYGTGTLFRKVKNRPLVSLSKKDIFSISIKRKEDILIEDITTGKTRSVIPDWITDYSDTNSFIILPTINDGKLFAIIFGSVAHGKPIQASSDDIKQLREIRKVLSNLKQLADKNEINFT